MTCNARTPNEILQEYAVQISDVWGETPLANPEDNISDPLVTLLNAVAQGQSQLEQRQDAFILSSNHNNLSGGDLTNYASARGIDRLTGTKSKAIIIVTGEDGSVLERNTLLSDKSGNAWQVTEDINLISTGQCAVASGQICAVNQGCLSLKPDEVTFNNSNRPDIFTVTNTQMLSFGGNLESDADLRDRLSNRTPFSGTVGHSSAAINDILNIDDVIFAKYERVSSCVGDGWMFVVKGGDESKICEVIRKHTTACNLVGGTSCPDTCLDEIRFQKASPVPLKINIQVTEGCPYPDVEKIKTLAMSQAQKLADRTEIRMIDFARLDSSIEFVNFERLSCPCDGMIDPFTGQELIFEDGMIFNHQPDCNLAINKFILEPWEFPVICEVDICNIESQFVCIEEQMPEVQIDCCSVISDHFSSLPDGELIIENNEFKTR